MPIRFSLLCLFWFPFLAPRAEVLWIEGESAPRAQVTRHPWWYDQVQKEQLSGGAWISHFNDKATGWVEFDVTATETGTYTLWLRANPIGAKLEVSLDGQPGLPVDFAGEKRQETNIAADHKPDLRFVCWVKAGTRALAKGAHTLRVASTGGPSNHLGLDCLVLANEPFAPQGFVKPGSSAPSGPADWFPVAVENDPFSAESVIDMSRLVPAPAGKAGRVKARGKDLVTPDGRAVKFWGCGANLETGKYSESERLQRIRYLRKHGVNIVREHPLWDEVSTDGALDPAKLAQYDRWFADLKAHGIHTQWSVFYHFPVRPGDGYDPALFAELEPQGNKGLRDSYGLLPISDALRELRDRQLRALLTHRNPHTGLTYAEDPALVTVEMQNEDCVFFWNPLGALAEGKKWPGHSRLLRRALHAWAVARHGGEAGAKAAWGEPVKGDDWAKGELAICGPWELDLDGPRGAWAGRTRRAGDYIRFLTELQRGQYEKTKSVIRSAGFDGVVVTTNWLAGNPASDPANIYADTVGDMIDRHNYAGGGAGGHGIREGQVYADSHLGKPGAHLFMIALKQVEDHPFSLSEWTMCPPNQWKAEAAPILAFYGMGLQGWDASFHFAQEGTRLDDGWPRRSSYATDTPHYLGQFPALAFSVLNGHYQEGPLVEARRLAPDDLFTGKAPVKQEYYDGKGLIAPAGGTPKEVFAIGRVGLSFGGGRSERMPLAPFWDTTARIVRAASGELLWDYGRERIEALGPRTQALIGRAQGTRVELPGVHLDAIQTPFVSLLFTPLDNEPLAVSRRVLITALARDKQTGSTYSEDGARLIAVGTPPLLLEPVQARLQFQGAKPRRVRALDPYGVPKGADLPLAADGSFTIDGTHRAYYYEVIR